MDFPKCKICKKSFNNGEQKPLILPNCGHTFCYKCINKKIETSSCGYFICPTDKKVS